MKRHKLGLIAGPPGRFRCVLETCGKRFQSRAQLGQHVASEHPSNENAETEPDVDVIALLSSVGDEMVPDQGVKKEIASLPAEMGSDGCMTQVYVF